MPHLQMQSAHKCQENSHQLETARRALSNSVLQTRLSKLIGLVKHSHPEITTELLELEADFSISSCCQCETDTMCEISSASFPIDPTNLTNLDRWKESLASEDRSDLESESDKQWAFLDAVFAFSNDCVSVLNPSGTLLWSNPMSKSTWNFYDQSVSNEIKWIQSWSGTDREAALESIASASLGIASGFRGFHLTVSGEEKWWDVSVTPMLSPLGVVAGVLSVSRDVTNLVNAQKEMIHRLAIAAEYRDDCTGSHNQRIGHYSSIIAKHLGFDDAWCDMIAVAATLHDVGKIGIPDSILLKPGKLDPEERKFIETHCLIGAQILADPEDVLLRMACQIALTHHEAWDGTGYLNRLAGEQIPIEGRIVAVVDIYDALTTVRPYKAAWTHQAATEEIHRLAGSKLDPAVVSAFFDAIDEIHPAPSG